MATVRNMSSLGDVFEQGAKKPPQDRSSPKRHSERRERRNPGAESAQRSTSRASSQKPRENKKPTILIPKNPRLKLRHASESGQRPANNIDDQPVQRTEINLDEPAELDFPPLPESPASSRPRSEEKKGAELMGAGSPMARFIIFDHQRVQGRILKPRPTDESPSGS